MMKNVTFLCSELTLLLVHLVPSGPVQVADVTTCRPKRSGDCYFKVETLSLGTVMILKQQPHRVSRGGGGVPGALKFMAWSQEPDLFIDWSLILFLAVEPEPRDSF